MQNYKDMSQTIKHTRPRHIDIEETITTFDQVEVEKCPDCGGVMEFRRYGNDIERVCQTCGTTETGEVSINPFLL